MGENGRWITINGAHVFLKDGQSPMDAFIRQKAKSEDEAVHYGDLGKARDTTYFSINSSNRSTGHFGTGTYFISPTEDEKMQKSPFFSRKDRPRKVVNFNDYDLYKPLIEPEARRLHDGLKAINYGKYDDFDIEIMSMDLKRNGITQDKIDKAINKVKQTKEMYVSKGYDDAYDQKYDSMSTIFMKELGYNGIDVRGLEGYDNTAYGSVIYDINKKKGDKK